jgi:hypothetical protein
VGEFILSQQPLRPASSNGCERQKVNSLSILWSARFGLNAIVWLLCAGSVLVCSRQAFAASGYRVEIHSNKKKPGSLAPERVTVVSVAPLPDNQYEFVGLSKSSWIHRASNDQKAAFAEMMIAEVESAYFKIASSKGLFILGDRFHDSLKNDGGARDGRSAVVAVYEGSGLTHPRATLRVSYATEKSLLLPFIKP